MGFKNKQRIESVLHKIFFYTKRTLGSDNIIQLSRGICTLSILYFWPTTLLKQTIFPFHLVSIFRHSYFQKVSGQPGVVVLVQTALTATRGSEMKLDPLTPKPEQGRHIAEKYVFIIWQGQSPLEHHQKHLWQGPRWYSSSFSHLEK